MTVTQMTKHLISYRSLTPHDGGAFDFITAYLHDFEAIKIDREGVKNLLLRKHFGEGPHIAFAGHIDVVPEGNGWESDPFEAIEKEGYIFGRGAQDMKSGMAAFLVAVRELQTFQGTISLLLTSDEEGDGIYGTQEILLWMKEQGCLPQMCIVAEPTCEEVFGDAIKVGRRGSINGKIIITGQGGHAAYPAKAVNPIELVSTLLPQLSGKNLDEGDEFFQPSRLVMTTLQAGRGTTNVIPHDLTLLFNVRNNTLTTKETIEQEVREALKVSQIEHYTLEVAQSSYPFVTKEGPYSQKLIGTLCHSIESITGMTPKKSTAGGTSDARYIAAFGIDVVEFGVRNNTIHAPNECVALSELDGLKGVFSHFLATIMK